MVTEAAMAAKKNKDPVNKKVFSVPVGKLRSKTSGHCRSGSFSSSASRSKLHYKILMKNNRELAYALSKQKELTKASIDDKLKLTSLLHESKLKVVGLEKKFEGSMKSIGDFRKCIMDHIKNAVKHSVLLTESLKLAMTATYEGSAQQNVVEVNEELPQKSEIPGSCCLPINPQKHRVNPMIDGHTIRYPTINLQRVKMHVTEKATERNDTETVVSIAENVQEASLVEYSLQSSGMGLSTCVEEDEEDSEDENISNTSVREEHEDSFRRRTVSFRNRVIDKDKQQWQLEGANDASKEITMDQEEINKKIPPVNGVITNSTEQPRTSRKRECTSIPDSLTKRTPVVALNDVSRFLHKSNSVNILQMSLDSHKAVKVASGTPNAPEVEKENLPSNKATSESTGLKSFASCSSEAANECIASDEESTGCPLSYTNTVPVQTSLSSSDDDPLEGTSWMYTKLYENNTKKSAHGRSKNNLKKTQKQVTRPKRTVRNTTMVSNQREKVECLSRPSDFNSKSDVSEQDDAACNTDVDNSSVRKNLDVSNVSDVLHLEPMESLKNQLQDVSSISRSSSLCNESLQPSFKDLCEINKALQNNLAVQSTPNPINDKHSPKNSDTHSCTSKDFFEKSSNQAGLSDFSESSASQESCKVGEKVHSEKEPIDSKLSCNAYVTVRVRKLKYIENAIIEDTPASEDEIEKFQDSSDDCFGLNRANVFLGFSDSEASSEYAKAKKDGLKPLNNEEFISTEYSRSIDDATGSEGRNGLTTEGSSRPKRKAAPRDMKEPSNRNKLRRDSLGSKKRKGK